jgi:hypothetical protein
VLTVSDSNTPSNKQDARKIKSRTLEIENGFIRAGAFSIQIANIVSMSVKENTQRAVKATALGYAITFCLLLALSKNPPVAIAASPVVALISSYRAFRGELLIVTSAGTSFLIVSRSRKFLDKLKGVVEMAKTGGGDSFYTINRIDKSITDNRVQASATTHVGDVNKINVGDISGDNATVGVRNAPTNQQNKYVTTKLDLPSMASGLRSAFSSLRDEAESEEQCLDLSKIAGAAAAAERGDESGFLEKMKGISAWAGNRLADVGTKVLSDFIKHQLGL